MKLIWSLLISMSVFIGVNAQATQFVCHPKTKRAAIQVTYDFIGRVQLSNKGYRMEPGIFIFEAGKLGGILFNRFNSESSLRSDVLGTRKVSTGEMNRQTQAHESYQAEVTREMFENTFLANSLPGSVSKMILSIFPVKGDDRQYEMIFSEGANLEEALYRMPCEKSAH